MNYNDFGAIVAGIEDEADPAVLHRRIREAQAPQAGMTRRQRELLEAVVAAALAAYNLESGEEDELLTMLNEKQVEAIVNGIQVEADPALLHQRIQDARDRKAQMTERQQQLLEAEIAEALDAFGLRPREEGELLGMANADGDLAVR